AGLWPWMAGLLGVFTMLHHVAQWQVERALGQEVAFRPRVAAWVRSLLTLSPYFFMSAFFGWYYTLWAYLSGLVAVLLQVNRDIAGFKNFLRRLLPALATPGLAPQEVENIREFQSHDPGDRAWQEFLGTLQRFALDPAGVRQDLPERALIFKARGLDPSLADTLPDFLRSLELGQVRDQSDFWSRLNLRLVSRGFYVSARAQVTLNGVQIVPYFYKVERLKKTDGKVRSFFLRGFANQPVNEAPRFFNTSRPWAIIPLDPLRVYALETVLPVLGGHPGAVWHPEIFGKDDELAAMFMRQVVLSGQLNAGDVESLKSLAVLIGERESLLDNFFEALDGHGAIYPRAALTPDSPLVFHATRLTKFRNLARQYQVTYPPRLTEINLELKSRQAEYEALVDKITYRLAESEETQRVLQNRGWNAKSAIWASLSLSAHPGLDLALLLHEARQPGGGAAQEAVSSYFPALAHHLNMPFDGREKSYYRILYAFSFFSEENPQFVKTLRAAVYKDLMAGKFAEQYTVESNTPLSLPFWFTLLDKPQDLEQALKWGKIGLKFEPPAFAAMAVALGLWGSPLGLLAWVGLAGLHTFLKWRVDRARGQIVAAQALLADFAVFLMGLSPYLLPAWLASLSLAPVFIITAVAFAILAHVLIDLKFFNQINPPSVPDQNRIARARARLFALVPNRMLHRLIPTHKQAEIQAVSQPIAQKSTMLDKLNREMPASPDGLITLTGALNGTPLPVKAISAQTPGVSVAAVQDLVLSQDGDFNTWLAGTLKNLKALSVSGTRLAVFPERYLATADPALLEQALAQLQTQANTVSINLVMGLRVEVGEIPVDGILAIRPGKEPIILRALSTSNLWQQESQRVGFD
ncbi:MAG: hypothetical protein HGA76_11065, partial [Candidatus Firestonebacteria bacterium]|nr:hypothetical protein [Candidatus Firestonebacteria bacterium]